MTENSHEEILDLVNGKDEVIGTIPRSDYYRMVEQELGYIRAAEMLIRNDAGKYWIPIRTADKKIAPNGLDYSMGGHVGSGEDYMEAALREIKEELNLELRPDDLEFVTKVEPGALPYFCSVYLYRSNDAPQFNPHDFASAEWLSLQEIENRLADGVPSKANLLPTVQAVETYVTSHP